MFKLANTLPAVSLAPVQAKKNLALMGAELEAISKSQAVIEFDMNGNILHANSNFLGAVGYSLDEIKGQHHRMFVDPAHALSPDYQDFWSRLRRGEYSAAEYQRFGKGGKEIWIQASYNPILDDKGRPVKVVKYATDITAEKLRAADFSGQIAAIGKSQAVIEFNMDGNIVHANANFLQATGYSLEEIRGRHHRMFVEPGYAEGREYDEFWAKLRRGEYSQAEYQRFGKGGREIWIQASYNPILDTRGKPFKVVKYATDITQQVKARKQSSDLTGTMRETIQTAAAATEEMTASIQEIGSNMTQSRNAVTDIVNRVQQADELMAKLQDTSKSMGAVAELIRNIAGQVNLLALNATIEAARAGAAGKGFAVVAGEVKTLASQVGNATDDISRKIEELQDVSAKAAESSRSINQAVGSVSQSVNAVASAIEQQSAATQEISSGMQRAFQGVEELNLCIQKLVSV
jgi:methyl-accepting chemotaxis protein